MFLNLIEVAELCSWHLFALSLEEDILPEGLENFWKSKYAPKMGFLIEKLENCFFLHRSALAIEECNRCTFGLAKIELTLPMYQAWELAKFSANHTKIEVDWEALSPLSGLLLITTVGTVAKVSHQGAQVFLELLKNMEQETVYTWSALELLSAVLIKTLDAKIRKKLMIMISCWSKVFYFFFNLEPIFLCSRKFETVK